VSGPVFLAGSSRSGKTLLRSILAESDTIAVTRRTDMWPRFVGRYGDLSRRRNLDRCLDAMLQRKQIAALEIDPDRLRREFVRGEHTYARLFDLMNRQVAERARKSRWLDQTARIDEFAGDVIASYPGARVLHLIRDPRDSYVAWRQAHGEGRGMPGRFARTWVDSATRATRNASRFADSYVIVQYETLVTEPEPTIRRVCALIDERFRPAMLELPSSPRYSAQRAQGEPVITDRFVGVHDAALDPRAQHHIAAVAGGCMRTFGYAPFPIRVASRMRLQATVADWPVVAARTIRRRAVRG
jgi:hypothetical protein